MDNKKLRKGVQAAWAFLTNAYVKGVLPGPPPLYQGKLKSFCVPGLNCYSCPAAVSSCPIGALQALFDGRQRRRSADPSSAPWPAISASA